MDEIDRAIINTLQGGFPICDQPFAAMAEPLGLTAAQLLARIIKLKADGIISRFGPMWHAERMGGELTLAAMKVPQERFDEVAGIVNSHPEVSQNYAREHALNMWFVVATEKPGRKAEVLAGIEAGTGIPVHDMPKIQEFFVGLRFEA
ncbi:Heme d1 biosynthesis protein NirG [Paramagnetospirillum magnetotacticum MS-1]|uniref:siroheme decarboxylase n=1 Tax=Paramagnetospirillum magnetotacticum MS-1 TaxID=272627 RepID=A0A0C2V4H1_PARME|nr:AsnC family transcriptional regulator [Paramagnetospirillum magnetotacticum]KIL99976.1 Heme d1 biosynthesis protein NirG [Paramagnetospirillum magnetotacticum MS-1]